MQFSTSNNFLTWFYGPAVGLLFNIYKSIILIVFNFFSIGLLLRYLFAPWKRDIVRPVTPSLSELWQAFLQNLTSRLIGTIIRTLTIIFGLLATLATIILGAFLFLLFLALPMPTGLLTLLIYFSFHFVYSFPSSWALAALLLTFLANVITYLFYRKFGLKNFPLKESLRMAKFRLAAGQKINLSTYLDYDCREILKKCHNFNTFQKLIFQDAKVKFCLYKAGFSPQIFLQLPPIPQVFPNSLLEYGFENALKMGHGQIETGDLFLAFIQIDQGLQAFFEKYGLKIEDLESILRWQTSFWQTLYPPSSLLTPNLLRFTGGLGKDWQAGYTPVLSRFSTDLTAAIKNYPEALHFQAHKKEISQIEQILEKSTKNNALLIGEAGIGKRTLVLGFAKEVLFGKTLKALSFKKVVELDLNQLLAAAEGPEQAESLLVSVLNEAVSAGNIILFIDGIERILGKGERLGTISAADIFIPYLRRNDLQLVATTDYPNYHKLIEKNEALEACFEKVEVKEPDEKETLQILQDTSASLEAKNKVIVTYLALKEIIKQAKRYLTRKFPEKAIDLLDEALVFVATKTSEKILLPSHIDQLISYKTHIPVGEIKKAERQRLLNLEQILHKRLVNQDEAVKAISEALRRARAGIAKTGRPLGTFLFLGPTGVGKTETAKTLAEAYFGSEKNMIRLDMSEYQQISDIEKLTGSEQMEGFLTTHILERPFSLLLLDEIEKAHPNILNLFLQILDEGKIKDYAGREINFENTIIIGTSNAGAEFIREKIKEGQKISDFKQEFLDELLKHGIFRPEFLNRFDAVVAFRPLTKEELVQVVEILARRLNERLKEKEILVKLNTEAKQKLAKLGFDPQFGARALARTMVEKVENLVAQKILKEELKKGQTLEITTEMI